MVEYIENEVPEKMRSFCACGDGNKLGFLLFWEKQANRIEGVGRERNACVLEWKLEIGGLELERKGVKTYMGFDRGKWPIPIDIRDPAHIERGNRERSDVGSRREKGKSDKIYTELVVAPSETHGLTSSMHTHTNFFAVPENETIFAWGDILQVFLGDFSKLYTLFTKSTAAKHIQTLVILKYG